MTVVRVALLLGAMGELGLQWRMRIVADGDPANGHQAVFVTVAGRDLSAIPNGRDISMCVLTYMHTFAYTYTYIRIYVHTCRSIFFLNCSCVEKSGKFS